MNFETFNELIKDNVSRKMGEGYKVEINNIRKNNGLVLSGLTIKRDDTNVAPTIYLNEYYEMYENGRYTIYTAVNDILKVYEQSKKQNNFDVKFFLDFETVRPYIIHKLVNTEKNNELLNEIPHVNVFDLSIIFQVLLPETDKYDSLCTITIRNEHCRMWEIGIDDLVFSARCNTPRLLPYSMKSVSAAIREMGIELYSDIVDNSLRVITNDKQVNGACAMLDKSFLRECAENIGSSYYILPSSIHECLLLPDDGSIGANDLKEMVQEINDSELSIEEILSYSVYYFDKETDRLSVL